MSITRCVLRTTIKNETTYLTEPFSYRTETAVSLVYQSILYVNSPKPLFVPTHLILWLWNYKISNDALEFKTRQKLSLKQDSHMSTYYDYMTLSLLLILVAPRFLLIWGRKSSSES